MDTRKPKFCTNSVFYLPLRLLNYLLVNYDLLKISEAFSVIMFCLLTSVSFTIRNPLFPSGFYSSALLKEIRKELPHLKHFILTDYFTFADNR